ncbi:MAG TPA: STAS domain-containing protein [Pirellulales bacterium]|jgi:anti-anti-sigma factor|nr:STAS domain-containing protein [Pirellulales bacterium]
MNLPTEIFGDVVVVHSPEELGNDHAERIETFILGLDHARVVLDLDNTETIDSTGLLTLLSSQEQLRSRLGDLKIATTNAMNRKILEITRLDQQLEVFESVIDAVRSFAG